MYKSLQAGRAAAATLVVLYHLGGAIAATKYFGVEAFSKPFSFGAAGVEFFFVLSGFIIFSVHRGDLFRPERLASYARKRAVRIYPIYWIVFGAVFLAAIASPALRSTVPHDPVVLAKAMLLVPQDPELVRGGGAPVLGVAWTLQYEMFFYLLFACLIVSRWLSIAVGLALVVVLVRFLGDPAPSYLESFVCSEYVPLFGMGMAVAAATASSRVVVRRPVLYAGAGAILFLAVAADAVVGTDVFLQRRTILFGVASSLIVFGVVRAEDQGRVFGGQRWVQLIGDSSYALYLIHFPIISILCKVLMVVGLKKGSVWGASTAYLVILAACLLSAVAIHLWIEKPIARLLRERRGTRAPAPAIAEIGPSASEPHAVEAPPKG